MDGMMSDPFGVFPTGPTHLLHPAALHARRYQWYEVPASRSVNDAVVAFTPTCRMTESESFRAISNRVSAEDVSVHDKRTVPGVGDSATSLSGGSGGIPRDADTIHVSQTPIIKTASAMPAAALISTCLACDGGRSSAVGNNSW